ncbi:glutamate-cysteine ligase family protein [bacterium]|nr:glutamate-cysteine ligase family protein [bacterium]
MDSDNGDPCIGQLSRSDLRAPFRLDDSPATAPEKRVGIELEFFPIRGAGEEDSWSGALEVPPYYSRENEPPQHPSHDIEAPSFAVSSFLAHLSQHGGWRELQENGATIALERADEMVTLEPPGVIEYVSPPCRSLEELRARMTTTVSEFQHSAEACGFVLLATGYHPTARAEDLPLVPKARYDTMYRYMPTVGTRGVEMMKLTCATQVSIDFSDEQDAMRKLRLVNQLTPFLLAITANSPFVRGALSGNETERADIWQNTDPDRCGFPPFLFDKGLSLNDYIEWALDAPVYFLKRGDEYRPILDKTFRELCEGTEHAITVQDWDTHLGTLFPWARLKFFIEVRAFDSLPPPLAVACGALMTTLFYDDGKLRALESSFGSLRQKEVLGLTTRAGKSGLGDEELWSGAKEICQIAVASPQKSARSWHDPELFHPLVKRVHDRFLPSSLTPEQYLLQNLIEGE